MDPGVACGTVELFRLPRQGSCCCIQTLRFLMRLPLLHLINYQFSGEDMTVGAIQHFATTGGPGRSLLSEQQQQHGSWQHSGWNHGGHHHDHHHGHHQHHAAWHRALLGTHSQHESGQRWLARRLLNDWAQATNTRCPKGRLYCR